VWLERGGRRMKKLILIIFLGTFLFQGRVFDRNWNVKERIIVEKRQIKIYDKDWRFKKRIYLKNKEFVEEEECDEYYCN
jgi:hypothetical protein